MHRTLYANVVYTMTLLLIASCNVEKKTPNITGNVTPQSIYQQRYQLVQPDKYYQRPNTQHQAQQYQQTQQYQPRYQQTQPYGYYQNYNTQRYQQQQQNPYDLYNNQQIRDADFYYRAPTRYENIENVQPAQQPQKTNLTRPTDW